MASYSISNITSSSVTVYVSGIEAGQEIRIYIRRSSETGVALLDETYTSTSTGLSEVCSGLPNGTELTINVRYQGKWIGAQSFSTLVDAPTRPNDWYWTNAVSSGSAIKISASEWNNFCSRINEFRRYRSLSDYSFATVYSGTQISATIVNEVVKAIKGMSGYGTNLYEVSTGDAITASFFNLLKTELNAIP